MKREINKAAIFLLVFILNTLFTQILFAQENVVKEKSKDAFTELESDSLVLRFFDALTGNPVKGADVTIGETYQVQTDFEGRAFIIKPKEDGSIKVKFLHPDYITSEFEIEIMNGSIFFNRFSVSPKLQIGALRVVVDWGKSPRDLDAHLMKLGDYHISYRNLKVSDDGAAKLDRDEKHGYGPETITVNKIDQNSEYIYFVHDYSNKSDYDSRALSNSKATVKVFGDNKLLAVIQIPQNFIGNYWEVFRIVNGQIVKTNIIKHEIN